MESEFLASWLFTKTTFFQNTDCALGPVQGAAPDLSNYTSTMTGEKVGACFVFISNHANFGRSDETSEKCKFHIQVNTEEACGFTLHNKLF